MRISDDFDPNVSAWDAAYGNTICPIVTFDDEGNELHCFDIPPLPDDYTPPVIFDDDELPY